MHTERPRLLTVLPFIGIFSLFLYIANLVVYKALVDIFGISLPSQLIVLGILLGILSASLIISTVIGMRYYNICTRLYSLLSSVWMGFFVYLFLFSVLYGLLAMLPITLLHLNNVGLLCMACAVVLSIYGIFHAKNIHVTKVEISLQHLPSSWIDKKAIWVSDLHLGQIHGPSFARTITKKINALSPDIIFVGGDLYDGTSAPDVNELIAPLKELKALHGVYFITGNHEEFGNNEKFLSAIKSAGIEVLQDRMVEIDGLQLIGVDYQTASKKERFQKILSGLSIDANKVSILLKHEPKDLDVAREAGISLQISGHTHKAQLWPLGYVADFVYKGFAYGLKTLGGMKVYTSSGVGTWGPPMRVGTNSEIVVFNFIALQ